MTAHDAAAAWIYRGVWATIVSLFRVPSDPPALPSQGEHVRAIRPAPAYLRYLKFFFWLMLLPGDVLPVAAWIARMDGVVTSSETAALDRLGELLKVPERPREVVDKIVQEVISMSDDVRPARYDLLGLRRIISERLKASQAAKQGAEGG